LTINCPVNFTILELKEKIKKLSDIPVEEQLIYNGNIYLENENEMLSKY
jgi:hypothetical protein